LKTLCFSVTNDLVYDQRMIRICTTLGRAGYDVLLVGRSSAASPGLADRPYRQQRLRCFMNRGPLFYAEYNIRLLFFLLFLRCDAYCAIDLDTILPCYLASCLRGKPRFYDAHELFCEMKEVVSRPRIYRAWKAIEAFAMPRFPNGYTVCGPIADVFKKEYGVGYAVIRNLPFRQSPLQGGKPGDFLLYQGAVNEGRSFETLIPAMQWVDLPLHIYGDGNFMTRARELVRRHGLEGKVIFKGQRPPKELAAITPGARAGITLFENTGRSNYLSLANRFFDYIQAGIPQLCVDYPSYEEINREFDVAVLITDLSPENLARELNNLCGNEVLYEHLRLNCLRAAATLNWEAEEKTLLDFYQRCLP
jgi:glycosyltransferase involved in cell wall biosynthesis